MSRLQFTDWKSRHDELAVEPGTPIDFCNVTVTYTHEGSNGHINVYVLLPSDDQAWNGRFLGEGGAGWAGGDKSSLHTSLALGYATVITDAGTNLHSALDPILYPDEWALLSPGSVDWNRLQTFGSRAVDELPKIAKQVIRAFYGKPAHHSCWHECSTGGRQGLMSAQRFPHNWDGILSIAPSNNFATFRVTEH